MCVCIYPSLSLSLSLHGINLPICMSASCSSEAGCAFKPWSWTNCPNANPTSHTLSSVEC